jgi:hypothetical protein
MQTLRAMGRTLELVLATALFVSFMFEVGARERKQQRLLN